MMVKSWGNYPTHPQTSHVTNWRDNLSADFLEIVKNHQTTLPFGNGRSYGDSCMASSGHVLQTRYLDRFIEVDWTRGVIKAEAGVTLEEVLNLSIAQGWFLPVTPGTKYVTLGGAVANDVHGKNHHIRGTFGCHVQSFSLLRSDQKSLICSPQENANLFSATIGGLGLTGIIEWVELKLMPISSSSIDSTAIRFNSIDEFFDLSNELDAANEYSVAWIDCSNVGRGVFFVGNHAKNGELKPSQKPKITMPITPPFSLINGLSLKFLNAAYYNLHKKGRQQKTLNYDPFFYPLDGILKWNRVYGQHGFQQYQCVIPKQNSRAAIKEILNEIARAGAGSFLAVLKCCGEIKSPGLLSFPLPGISLALDFAQRDEFNKKLFARLDEILRQANGRLYPAKDAHMSAEDFKNFYPNWQSLESLRDPALSSHFWNRILL